MLTLTSGRQEPLLHWMGPGMKGNDRAAKANGPVGRMVAVDSA